MLLLPTVGPAEIAIVAIVVILLFGVGKLSGLGKDLGGSIKEFRRAMKDEDETEAAPAPAPAPQQYAQTTTQAPQPAAPEQPAQAAPVNPEQPRQDPGQRPNVF